VTVSDPQSPFDLDAYFGRIGYQGARQATFPVLAAIAERHTLSIPFENLDILLGRPVHLDAAALEAKLVHGKRGGYCFEHNTLVAGVLRQLGFDVTALSARVRWMVPDDVVSPRTHMLLAVKLDGERWLVDCGFGALGLTAPLRMDFDGEQPSRFEAQRVVGHPAGRLLQARVAGEWRDLYLFTEEPAHPIDFEVANWFTSAHPESRFQRNLIAMMVGPGARHTLHNRDLSTYRDGGVERQRVDDPDELLAILSSLFSLSFPPGTRFGAPGAPWAR
jgi:N-hydroxyarylamine O-acetyltransferase